MEGGKFMKSFKSFKANDGALPMEKRDFSCTPEE